MKSEDKINLFYKAKNFCSVPWNHFKVAPNGDLATCVKGDIIASSTDTYFNSNKLFKIKQDILEDKVNANCMRCIEMEGQGYNYLRDLYNPMFALSEVDYNSNDFTLSGVDLHWGSTCQLKCITCWSEQSSSIAKEEGKPIINTSKEKADKLIDFIVDNQSTLKEIYLSGGEPTLIKHNYRLLSRLTNKDCQIRINTNLMFDLDNKILQELKKFPNVLVTISAEAMGERFNYIRRGASWDKFIYNLKELQKTTHFKWRLNTVFFAASALYITDLYEYFANEFNITDITINQLVMGHTMPLCRNLSTDIKQKCVDKLVSFSNRNKDNTNLVGQINNCLLELAQPTEADYKQYFEDIDSKAGTNWIKTFPELV